VPSVTSWAWSTNQARNLEPVPSDTTSLKLDHLKRYQHPGAFRILHRSSSQAHINVIPFSYRASSVQLRLVARSRASVTREVGPVNINGVVRGGAALVAMSAFGLGGCSGGHQGAKNPTASLTTSTAVVSSTSSSLPIVPTTATSPTSVASTTALAPTTTGSVTSDCTITQIVITFVGSEGAGGTDGSASFLLRGTTAAGCHTFGYPGVQFLGASGQTLPIQGDRGSGILTHAGPPQTVTLSTTAVGIFTIEYFHVSATGGSCPAVASVRLIPPNQTQSIAVQTATAPTSVPFAPCFGQATVTPIQQDTVG
jgi:hypothetical protein